MKKEFVLGELILLEKFPIIKGKNRKARYKCFCGKEFIALMGDIRTGDTKSCGCFKRKTVYKEGDVWKRTRIYNIYKQMKQRCYNPKNTKYACYGERGITVCEEWKNSFVAFRDWALSHGYQEHLTIDRKDNNGNYEPDNCRWVTKRIQNISLRLREKTTSGFTGVTVRGNKFSAAIRINNKAKYLGIFDTAEDAHNAYLKAKEERDKMYLTEEGLL